MLTAQILQFTAETVKSMSVLYFFIIISYNIQQ